MHVYIYIYIKEKKLHLLRLVGMYIYCSLISHCSVTYIDVHLRFRLDNDMRVDF
jgi:hypothetical protein